MTTEMLLRCPISHCYLTVALAEHATGTVASKNMQGTGSFVTALPKGSLFRGRFPNGFYST